MNATSSGSRAAIELEWPDRGRSGRASQRGYFSGRLDDFLGDVLDERERRHGSGVSGGVRRGRIAFAPQLIAVE